MHPIGTRIHRDGVGISAYTTNSLVPEPVLREFVQSLSILGRHCFPDVLTMIQDLEADSGIAPVPPMDGDGHRVQAMLRSKTYCSAPLLQQSSGYFRLESCNN
jgi:hypothetical protein